MNQDVSEKVSCRACGASIARNTAVCPSCGAREPSIPDEPTASPRLVRLVMWGIGIVTGLLLLVVAGMLAFGPAATDDERDHNPPSRETPGAERHR